MDLGIPNMWSFWIPAYRSCDTEYAQWTFGLKHGQMQLWGFISP